MCSFDSLTLALEDWFDTPLADLPDALRKRVVHEFFPMPWDNLSADQRRSVALQLDYQHDPAMESDRQDWWDFFQRMDAVKAQIAEWNAVATPTAGELALKEKRLAELQQELARMDAQVRHARGDYFPQRNLIEAKDEAPVPEPTQAVWYIAYPKAMYRLAARLGATPEEVAAWVFWGPGNSGLAAYVNANELDPPPRFHFGFGGDFDFVSALMATWFSEDEIAHFEPVERYITGDALLQRWKDKPGLQAEAFILAKIRESRLQDIHPMFGGTRGTFQEHDDFPPLTSGLFMVSQVEQVEAEDFAKPVDRGQTSKPIEQCIEQPINDPEEDIVGRGGPSAATQPNAIFLGMENLSARELTIAFVGDRAESGLGANNMLEISARGETRRIALAGLNLVDRRRGYLNSQGAILLGMAHKKTLTRTDQTARKMSRLRDVFRVHLGINKDPFEAYRKGRGWVPHFRISDKRGAADERAQREAERRTDSYEALTERGNPFAASGQSEHPFNDDDDDAASAWLRENDPDARA
jgi:hypothetical protein